MKSLVSEYISSLKEEKNHFKESNLPFKVSINDSADTIIKNLDERLIEESEEDINNNIDSINILFSRMRKRLNTYLDDIQMIISPSVFEEYAIEESYFNLTPLITKALANALEDPTA